MQPPAAEEPGDAYIVLRRLALERRPRDVGEERRERDAERQGHRPRPLADGDDDEERQQDAGDGAHEVDHGEDHPFAPAAERHAEEPQRAAQQEGDRRAARADDERQPRPHDEAGVDVAADMVGAEGVLAPRRRVEVEEVLRERVVRDEPRREHRREDDGEDDRPRDADEDAAAARLAGRCGGEGPVRLDREGHRPQSSIRKVWAMPPLTQLGDQVKPGS